MLLCALYLSQLLWKQTSTRSQVTCVRPRIILSVKIPLNAQLEENPTESKILVWKMSTENPTCISNFKLDKAYQSTASTQQQFSLQLLYF
jgi:hypothetical protein